MILYMKQLQLNAPAGLFAANFRIKFDRSVTNWESDTYAIALRIPFDRDPVSLQNTHEEMNVTFVTIKARATGASMPLWHLAYQSAGPVGGGIV